jgi:hypothetical protein
MKSANEILRIVNPGDLFSNDESTMKGEYRNLAKHWHPDVHKDSTVASEVMTKINTLYAEGLKLLKDGKWVKGNFIQFKAKNGKTYKLHYLTEHTFELGKCYIGKSIVSYVVDKTHKDFYDNYLKRITNFKYANPDMKAEFEKYLPVTESTFETDEFFGVIVRKPDDVLSLRDALTYFKGTLPDRHVAWILSSLYNMACFLDYNKLSHNGINIDNYFISPQFHSGMLLGGWWYTVGYGEKLTGAPKNVFDIMTLQTKRDKIGTYITDLDSIRQIGRELCGDKFSNNLLKSSTIPSAITEWLIGGSLKKPIDEYVAWGKALDSGYGKRTFVELKLSASDLYPNE